MIRRPVRRTTRRSGNSRRRVEWQRQPGQKISQMSMLMENPVNQEAFWSQETFSLEDITTDDPLPKIVRCSSRLIPGEEQGLPVNIHVPMLLCAGRTTKKLLAKHVGMEARGHRLTETDDSIVIPFDYEGNFLPLQARTTKDQSAMKTLAQIAESRAPAFLSLTPITVFYRTQVGSDISATGNNKMADSSTVSTSQTGTETSKLSKLSKTSTMSVTQRRVLAPPGSVFLIAGISKGLAKGKKKSKEVTLLKCTDPNGNAVLISADQPGEFVEVEAPTTGESKLSKKSSELILANRYPSLVRFVYGEHIPRLTPCSYLFTLVDTFKEDSLIGCLLYPKHAILIELPVMSSLRFQVALNTDDLLKLPLPQHALDVVEDRRSTFMTDLKLKCKFLHRVSQGEGIDVLDDMQSATVRTRQFANEAFFYL